MLVVTKSHVPQFGGFVMDQLNQKSPSALTSVSGYSRHAPSTPSKKHLQDNKTREVYF